MADIDNTTEQVIDAAADVAAEIAWDAEQVEAFIRSMSKIKLKFALLGVAIGTAAGGITAFYIAYRKAELKYRKISDEEISGMREHYLEKTRALESEAQKRPLKEIIAERGYAVSETSDGPPMAVQPPSTGIVDDDDSAMAADDVEGPNGIRKQPPDPPPVQRNIFRDRQAAAEEVVLPEWNYHEERKRRSPDQPYVIHYDERHEMDYQHVTLTYYTVDDVLCNDRDEPVDPEDRDRLIGDGNLDRFGHGSKDPAIVYIRNDELELMYEVVKSPNSYSEEVHGFSHEAYDRGNLERMRTRERDDPEE